MTKRRRREIIEAVWHAFGTLPRDRGTARSSYAALAQDVAPCAARSVAASERVPDPSGLPSASIRDGDAALYAPPADRDLALDRT